MPAVMWSSPRRFGRCLSETVLGFICNWLLNNIIISWIFFSCDLLTYILSYSRRNNFPRVGIIFSLYGESSTQRPLCFTNIKYWVLNSPLGERCEEDDAKGDAERLSEISLVKQLMWDALWQAWSSSGSLAGMPVHQ